MVFKNYILVHALKRLVFTVLLLLSLPLSAATVLYDGDKISGVSGLEAIGTLWDVSFNEGPEVAVYPTGSEYPFVYLDAYYASESLLDSLMMLVPSASFYDFAGCDDTSNPTCYLITPHSLGHTATLGAGAAIDWTGQVVTATGYGTSTIGNLSFLVWTPHPVPLPASIWLFGSALIGLLGIVRHKRS